jgi:hypothetical protein
MLGRALPQRAGVRFSAKRVTAQGPNSVVEWNAFHFIGRCLSGPIPIRTDNLAVPRVDLEILRRSHCAGALESVEAALRLLTGQNHDLIRIIQAGKFNSMAELAVQSGRAESNLDRTIKKLSNLGLVS